uniref:Anoctamin n=1 Tax=Rhabditophanes sp. KR3021 TaxID=114890 RepID=A0AC35U3L4_9BILA
MAISRTHTVTICARTMSVKNWKSFIVFVQGSYIIIEAFCHMHLNDEMNDFLDSTTLSAILLQIYYFTPSLFINLVWSYVQLFLLIFEIEDAWRIFQSTYTEYMNLHTDFDLMKNEKYQYLIDHLIASLNLSLVAATIVPIFLSAQIYMYATEAKNQSRFDVEAKLEVYNGKVAHTVDKYLDVDEEAKKNQKIRDLLCYKYLMDAELRRSTIHQFKITNKGVLGLHLLDHPLTNKPAGFAVHYVTQNDPNDIMELREIYFRDNGNLIKDPQTP